MLEHQEVSVDADEALWEGAFLCLLDGLGTVLFTDQMDVPLFGVCC